MSISLLVRHSWKYGMCLTAWLVACGDGSSQASQDAGYPDVATGAAGGGAGAGGALDRDGAGGSSSTGSTESGGSGGASSGAVGSAGTTGGASAGTGGTGTSHCPIVDSGAAGSAGTNRDSGGRLDSSPGADVACVVQVGSTDAGAADPTARLGLPCDHSGALACNGENQKQAILCSQGTWQLYATCSDGQNCDQMSGVCADIVSDCADHAPDEAFCTDDILRRCGPDRVTMTGDTCCGACRQGACQVPRCGDGKIEPGEECDDGNLIAGDGCEPECTRSRVLAIGAGSTHTCALLRGGRVRCWGGNDSGQIGLGHHDDVSAMKPYKLGPVDLCGRATALAVGGRHTCALMDDGAVQCWGNNDSGQLGLGHTGNVGDIAPFVASPVPLGAKATMIAAGGDDTCAVLEDQSLRCWGNNSFGQLGLGHTRSIGGAEIPSANVAKVPLGANVVSVGVSGTHTCAILDPPELRCWGLNDAGQLGLGHANNIGDDEVPTAATAGVELRFSTPAPYRLISITLGGKHSALLFQLGSELGMVQYWGENRDGSLGIAQISDWSVHKAFDHGAFVLDGRPATKVTVGLGHVCFLLSNDRVRCFGLNEKAQLGLPLLETIGDDEDIGFAVSPLDLGLLPNGQPVHAAAAAAGARHTCALLATGEVRCWGYNAHGELGFGYPSPAPNDFVGGDANSVPANLGFVQVFPPSN